MTQDRIPLDAGSSRPAMEGEAELLPCPFCGKTASYAPTQCKKPPLVWHTLIREGVERELVDLTKRMRDSAASVFVGQREMLIEAASAISRLVKDEALVWKHEYRQEAIRANRAEDRFLKAEASVARLTALLAEADAVVKPFAEQSKEFDDAADQMGFERAFDEYRPRTRFTHGDLRAARRYQQKREAK